MTENNNIQLDFYKDRNGNIIYKPLASKNLIPLLYENKVGRLLRLIIASRPFANLERLFLDTGISSLMLDGFIRKNGIDLSDYVPKKYTSFNDFFTRKIIPKKRLMCDDDLSVISPSDGRATIYKINDKSQFLIKNNVYDIHSLLRDRKYDKYYKDGYIVIIRLCVDDYHHYSYVISGKKGNDRYIQGELHTVNPIIYDYKNVYAENSRAYSLIKAENGAIVTQMEVGAMGVGRIVNDEPEKGIAIRGCEKGHFEFGGSTIILLFPKDYLIPDEDILINTSEGFETKIKLGERIGKLQKP